MCNVNMHDRHHDEIERKEVRNEAKEFSAMAEAEAARVYKNWSHYIASTITNKKETSRR